MTLLTNLGNTMCYKTALNELWLVLYVDSFAPY